MTDQALATTLEDREGDLASKIQEFFPGVLRRFDVVAIQATAVTHPRSLSRLRDGKVVLTTVAPDTSRIGGTVERRCE